MADAGHNGFDPAMLKEFAGSILRHLETIDSYKGEHMRRCQQVHELIAQTYDRAKDAGISKKPLKALVKRVLLERRIEALSEPFDEDGDETYSQMVDAFGEAGDLPIFAAALEKAKTEAAPKAKGARSKKGNELDSLN